LQGFTHHKVPGELYNELDVHRSTSGRGREGSKSSHYEKNKSEVKGEILLKGTESLNAGDDPPFLYGLITFIWSSMTQ
jgi:hypothetical protein